MLAHQMGHTKLCPRISTNFWNKVFENITDDKIDWLPLYTSKFMASYWLNCLSLLCLFLCSYSALSWVVSELLFFVLCIYNGNNFKKQWKSPFNRAIILQGKHLVLCSYSSPVLLSRSFIGPPFWKKGPPKITEGGLLVPHWPISRINPGFDFIFSITMAITAFAKQVAQELHNGKIKKKDWIMW